MPFAYFDWLTDGQGCIVGFIFSSHAFHPLYCMSIPHLLLYRPYGGRYSESFEQFGPPPPHLLRALFTQCDFPSILTCIWYILRIFILFWFVVLVNYILPFPSPDLLSFYFTFIVKICVFYRPISLAFYGNKDIVHLYF